MKSIAAIATGANQELTIEEIDVAPPRAGEVLVEIMATGVCHTDAVMLEGLNTKAQFPTILGHEGAGRVVECGPQVTSVRVDDSVIPLYGSECRVCPHCISQRTNLCWKIRDTRDLGVMPDRSSRFSLAGVPIKHFMGTSTFSRYTVVPEISLAKIRSDAPLDKVCLLGCGVTTGIGAVLNDANVSPGDSVAVFGIGAVGLSAIQGARIAGALIIIAVDINPNKEVIARQMGATHFINPNSINGRIIEYIADLTSGGVDTSIECTGVISVMRDAIEACHVGWGTCVLTGVEASGQEVSIPPVWVRYGRTVKGSYFGGVRGRSELSRYVDMYMSGQIKIDELISHELNIKDVNKAFELMRTGQSTRSVLSFE
jgi:S-(hydroxymethyl)glutathione dehydrogenase / alcohol dehydrogenase